MYQKTQLMPITRLKVFNIKFGIIACRVVYVFTLDCDDLRDPGSGGANEDLRLDGSLGVSCPGIAKEALRLASFGSSLGSGFTNEALRPGSSTGFASAGLASAGFASAFLASTGFASAGLASAVLVSACGVFVSCVFGSGSGFELSSFYLELYTNIYTSVFMFYSIVDITFYKDVWNDR
jgi:hypothetical protein